jgi:7-carboxy-7-deazaguanine synthase
MRGNNPIRKPVQHDGASLEVKSVFATLQGEGPYTGWPSVFVRLGGCNLACTFCDTDFEDYKSVALASLIEEVKQKSLDEAGKRIRPLVVITGGEPLRQNIAPLCEALLAESFKVQIETNGTLYRALPEGVDIICSPKNTGGGYFPVREDLLPRVNAFKFIISSRDENYNHVGEAGQKTFGTPVYVQPMDEYDDARNAENLALALRLATEHGYRLSLQTHKILGIE